MIEDEIKEVLNGLHKELKNVVEQIVMAKFIIGFEYEKISELFKEGLNADITVFGTTVFTFKRTIKIDHIEASNGEGDINVELWLESTYTKTGQVLFNLVSALKGIEPGFMTKSELLIVDFGKLDLNSVNKLVDYTVDKLSEVLDSDIVSDFIDSSAYLMDKVIRGEHV